VIEEAIGATSKKQSNVAAFEEDYFGQEEEQETEEKLYEGVRISTHF